MNAGWLLFGLFQTAAGVALLFWPDRIGSLWVRSGGGRDTRALRGTRLVQRGVGLVFLVVGLVQAYQAVVQGDAAADGTVDGPARSLAFVFSALWCLVGVVMVLWPARFRSLTNPDWASYGEFARVSSSLISYRVTGIGFIVMGLVVLLVMADPGV